MAEPVMVNLAIQHIESKINGRPNTKTKVKSEATALLSELNTVNKQFMDAGGNSELSTSPDVRSSIGELARIAYAAEDEVDTLLSKSSSLSNLYLRFVANRASKKLRLLKEQTREVKAKLDRHARGPSKEPIPRARGSQAPTDHLPAAGDLVIGIDHQINRVVDQLTRKSKSIDGQPPVNRLAIVGMGGSGKTTLARSIYNHKAIKYKFHYQAWVSVSQGLDMFIVLVDILEQIGRQKNWFFSWLNDDKGRYEDEPDKLLERLMNNKTCLLVLDDVWDLQSLHKFIGNHFDSERYTIVITSRLNPVNNNINWCVCQPQCLTNDDSWKLLSQVASNSSKPLNVEYRALANEMLRKCHGLPLAIVALGRWLKTKDTKREWQRVLSQINGTDATSMYGPVNEIFGLSYDDLPNYLKPCFLYLGLFPEGSTISGGTLIRMWIAEGFIECQETGNTSGDKETLEVAGRRYLQEIIDHTMVDVIAKTYSGKAKTIRLHDIMRDICIFKASGLEFLPVPSSDSEATGKTSRRAAINSRSGSFILPANDNLRSLVLLGQSSTSAVPENNTSQVSQSCQKLASAYKLLRMLDIFGIKCPDGILPGEIGNLIHLTYLRIRSTNIGELPKTISKLRNLLTLDYRDVSIDTEVQVPNVLWKLERLRHLYLPNEMSGSVRELKLHTLKDLITLWGVGGGNWTVKEMGKMSSNLSKVFIHRISTEDQLKAVLGCPAIEKNGSLYALALNWYSFEFKNIELLAKQSLQKLKIMGQAPDKSQGLEFPSNLGKLELYYTQFERSETMMLLGRLVFLKVLTLSKDSYMGKEWSCTKESFPILEELKLANLPKLESWDMEKGAFRCLKKLSIVSCIKLKKMPEGLNFVRSLEKLDFESMPHNFVARFQNPKGLKGKGGGEDFHIIEHIPQVSFGFTPPLSQ